MRERPWEIVKDHLMIHVRVTPNARHNGIGRVHEIPGEGPVLTVFVSVPPEKGKANKAAIAILARALKVPKSAISVAMGETARKKVLRVAPPFGEAVERLEAMIAGHGEDDGR